MRRLILLLAVDWVPPSVLPSGACLSRGSRVLYKPPNTAEGSTKPGLRLCQCPLEPFHVTRFSGIHAIKSRLGLPRRWAPPGQWPT
jgi:hypothetical protein